MIEAVRWMKFAYPTRIHNRAPSQKFRGHISIVQHNQMRTHDIQMQNVRVCGQSTLSRRGSQKRPSLTLVLSHLHKPLPDRILWKIEHVPYDRVPFRARRVRRMSRTPLDYD